MALLSSPVTVTLADRSKESVSSCLQNSTFLMKIKEQSILSQDYDGLFHVMFKYRRSLVAEQKCNHRLVESQ